MRDNYGNIVATRQPYNTRNQVNQASVNSEDLKQRKMKEN